MADAKWEIGDNLKAVVLAVVGLGLGILQIWNVNVARDARTAADDARVLGQSNAAQIKRVRSDVRDGRNDTRRTMGLPPIAAPETDPE